MDDKIIAIVGLIAVSLFAIYQGDGNAESYELVKIITSAIAGFVTGTVVFARKDKKKDPLDGDQS